jgi:hypothetical protein
MLNTSRQSLMDTVPSLMESVARCAISFAATVIDTSNYDMLESNSTFNVLSLNYERHSRRTFVEIYHLFRHTLECPAKVIFRWLC